MSTPPAVVVCALAAALFFAASSALKHMSAEGAPAVTRISGGGLTRFVRATVTDKLWLAGMAFDVGGIGLQLVALHLGPLAVVQPLLVAGLVFALIMRRITGHRHVSRRQVAWAGLLAIARADLTVLVIEQPDGIPKHIDRLPAVVAAIIGAALATFCVLLGRRLSSKGASAAVLGVAVGLVYAATAALLKAITDIFVESPLHVLTSWQFYTVAAVGVLGLLLNQLAFQAGPLAASLPATASVDPLASVVVGVAVFDEKLHAGVGGNVLLAILLVVMGVAVVQVARTSEARDAP
jgi:drug/metabolite transporter (DMT)-like permease